MVKIKVQAPQAITVSLACFVVLATVILSYQQLGHFFFVIYYFQ